MGEHCTSSPALTDWNRVTCIEIGGLDRIIVSMPAGTMPDMNPVTPTFHLTRAQQLYMVLGAVSITCLLISDVVGVKLFTIPLGGKVLGFDSITHTCGMLAFPITFIVTDITNEFFGKQAARRIAILSFTMALLAFVVINASLAMPNWDVPFNVPKSSFEDVFKSARVMYIASLTAYLVGTFSDIAIFGVLKRLTRGKLIWLRATGSTVLSQMLDSLVVTYLAFSLGRQLFPTPGSSPMPIPEVLSTAATGYTLKFVIAISLTPVVYLLHRVIKKSLGLMPVPAERA